MEETLSEKIEKALRKLMDEDHYKVQSFTLQSWLVLSDSLQSDLAQAKKEKDEYRERYESVKKDKEVMFKVIADRQKELETLEKVCLNFLNAVSTQEIIIYTNEGCKTDWIQLIKDTIKRKKS